APRTGPPPLPVGQPVNTGFAPASPPAQSPPRRSSPDFSNLPPAIAESLAKLAGQLAGGSTSNSGNGGGDGNPPG
ncbi:MAG TPA: hypothetical protein VJ740_12885, partial [Hyphomicrobiaceae bacterium]|nr:hypothetical protein [Hyphomicrobiaceae bacterium]